MYLATDNTILFKVKDRQGYFFYSKFLSKMTNLRVAFPNDVLMFVYMNVILFRELLLAFCISLFRYTQLMRLNHNTES